MVGLLLAAHLLLFAAPVFFGNHRGIDSIKNLSLAVGAGFLYSSVVQSRASIADPALDLGASDYKIALAVSLFSYLSLQLGWWWADSMVEKRSSRRLVDYGRLRIVTLIILAAGCMGYLMIIRAVGGFWAYFGTGEMTGGYTQISGYIYMAKHLVFSGAGLLLLLVNLRKSTWSLKALLGILQLLLLWEALKTTDRGDTIRSALLIGAWVYLPNRRAFTSLSLPFKTGIFGCFLLVIGIVAVTLPNFRDEGRNLLRSELSVSQAFEKALEGEGASRISGRGGEFDSATRIIKEVNTGMIDPPGPVHIARVLWNVAPRKLFPDKWEIFDRWAGPEWQKILTYAASYPGCVPTGWGEAYGTLGWAGAILYWVALGAVLRLYTNWCLSQRYGLIFIVLAYLPAIQFAFMAFWSGAMTFLTMTMPALVVYYLVSRKAHHGGRRVRAKRRRIISRVGTRSLAPR